LAGLGHPIIFQRVSRLGSVTARQSSSGRQPNFAALNRGRHLYSSQRPSRWALAHILVLSSFFLFPRLTSAVENWMSTIYFRRWCGLTANVGRRSETCCTRLAENTGRKKSPKTCQQRTIVQLCRAISSQLTHASTTGKKTC